MAQDIAEKLKRLRAGVLFRESQNQPANAYDETELERRYGLTTIRIQPSDFEAAMKAVEPDAVAALMAEVKPALAPYASKTLERAARVCLAIKQFTKQSQLDLFVGDCVRMGEVFGASSCLALWTLYPGGVTIGCEGDLAGALALWIMRQLSPNVVLFDVTSVTKNRLTLSHCSIPFVTGTMRRGCFGPQVVQQGVLPAGEATLLQVSGVHADTWHITSARIAGTDLSEGLDVTVSITNADRFLGNVRGNHFVLAYGRHTTALQKLADKLGLRTLVD